MKQLAFVLSLGLLFALAVPMNSQAQTSTKIGPRVGIPVGDISDLGGNFFLGADARFDSEALPVVVNPSFDFYLMDDYVGGQNSVSQSVFTIDLNALYEFEGEDQAFTPYAGGGLAITRWSVDVPSQAQLDPSTTDVGLNLLGGVRFPLGSVEPFVQANFGLGGDFDRFGIAAGLLFSI